MAIALVWESCALIPQSGLPCSWTFPAFLPPADTQPIQSRLPGCGNPVRRLRGRPQLPLCPRCQGCLSIRGCRATRAGDGYSRGAASGRKLLESHQQHPWAGCSLASRDLIQSKSHCLLERNWGRGQEGFFGEAGSPITGTWRLGWDGKRGPEKRKSYGDCLFLHPPNEA